MATLRPPLLKVISKAYEANAMVALKFGRYDISLKTDDSGRPILLFIGKRQSDGTIKGDRYARRLLFDASGKAIKDHWDYKGKT